MAIARIVFTKIDGRIMEEAKADSMGLSVSSNITVDNVKIETISKQKIVVADWALDTEYKPKIGKIVVGGKVFLTGEPESITKKVDGKLALTVEQSRDVHQALLRFPLLLSTNIARELGLPLPMNFPTVQLEDNKSS